MTVLLGYDTDHVIQRFQQLIIPATNLSELLHAEIEKECSKLWLKHVGDVVGFVAVQMVEFEPQGHNLVVKVWTWLNEFDRQIFWYFT